MLAVSRQEKSFFYGILSIVVLGVLGALVLEEPLFIGLPILLVAGLMCLSDVRYIYYSFFIVIPFSIEYYIGSFGTDLPSEPIMLGLTLLTGIVYLSRMRESSSVFKQRMTGLLLLHVVWILFTAIMSQNQVLSFKFFLAKLWYVLPFYFLSFYMLNKAEERKRIIWMVTVCLFIAVCIVIYRHAGYGFAFKYYNKVVGPIFRNHVTYAAMIVVIMPLTWALLKNTESRLLRLFLWMVLGVFAVGTYFSYTRAAQGSILLMIIAFYILKFRLTKYVLAGTTVVVLALSIYMVSQNKYLDFAPNYEKTITHTNYDNLVEATVKLEDISTMERVYRWVAAGYMIGERPWLGYGPSTFYSHYMKYAVTDFKTYVSDNPEKSGIHNYYLMVAVEQGLLGLLIFIVMLFYALLKGEQVFHRLAHSKERYIVAGAWLCILVVSILHMMNDLLEVDKIGPFFFISMALICILDPKSKAT